MLSLHSNPFTIVQLESAPGSSSSSSAQRLLGNVRSMNGLLDCRTTSRVTILASNVLWSRSRSSQECGDELHGPMPWRQTHYVVRNYIVTTKTCIMQCSGTHLASTVSASTLKGGWHISKTAEVLGKACIYDTCSTRSCALCGRSHFCSMQKLASLCMVMLCM